MKLEHFCWGGIKRVGLFFFPRALFYLFIFFFLPLALLELSRPRFPFLGYYYLRYPQRRG